ncbi:MAG: NUDIX hydrolase [Spirochaetales bacterium]|nr:NUDIX hydrolase [Spirochaetales bacterium]
MSAEFLSDGELVFQALEDKLLHHTPIFDLVSRKSLAPSGRKADYVVIDAPDWVNVVAVVANAEKQPCFLMVRQFRHGSSRLYWEFPGGMVDPGELPATAAERELLEETGYRARSLKLLGHTNTNPAFMTNQVWCFLAEDAVQLTDVLELDPEEHLRVGLIPVEKVVASMGSGEFGHGVMMMALFWWQKAASGLQSS